MATDTEQIETPATDETTDEQRDEAMPDGLDQGAKAVISKERDARKATDRENRELKKRLKDLEDAEQQRIKDEQAAKDAKALEDGEFKDLAIKRGEELETVSGERDSLQSRLDKAVKLVKASVESEWKDTPTSVTKLYKGDPEDVLAMREHLDDHAELIAELKGKADATRDRFAAASRTRTPTPDTSGTPIADDEARKAQARAVSRF